SSATPPTSAACFTSRRAEGRPWLVTRRSPPQAPLRRSPDMAIDRTYGTTSAPSATDSRLERSLRLDWSAIIGGSLIGWGALLFLSLIGMILGLSVLDPFAARPARSNLGAGLWGAGAAVVASFIGAYFVVRLAGERRRAESLM